MRTKLFQLSGKAKAVFEQIRLAAKFNPDKTLGKFGGEK